MKRNVLVFGLISGLIISLFLLISIGICYRNNKFEGNVVVGYAAMILAFSLVFVGVKNFRDKYNGGNIRFGKAFKMGLYIVLIASTMYVLAWLVDYYLFVPDFMDRYTEQVIRQAKSSGSSAVELGKKTEEMAQFKSMYKNPFFVILLTYLEILPVGLIVSLLSALILKRKATARS